MYTIAVNLNSKLYILESPTSWLADLQASSVVLQAVVVVSVPFPCPVALVVCCDSVAELVSCLQEQKSELPRYAATKNREIKC